MSLRLAYHANFNLSLKQTTLVLKNIHGISISHQAVANYALSVVKIIKPFIDTFDYTPSSTLIADETYIKIKGVKAYIWFVIDAVSRPVIGHRVSDNRAVAPYILAMRSAF